jgi:hypothetical protein
VTTAEAKKRTRRSPEEIVRALLDKTVEKGVTAGEERAAVAKAEQLIVKHRLDRKRFEFPPNRNPRAKASKRRTIRQACEELLRREPALVGRRQTRSRRAPASLRLAGLTSTCRRRMYGNHQIAECARCAHYANRPSLGSCEIRQGLLDVPGKRGRRS